LWGVNKVWVSKSWPLVCFGGRKRRRGKLFLFLSFSLISLISLSKIAPKKTKKLARSAGIKCELLKKKGKKERKRQKTRARKTEELLLFGAVSFSKEEKLSLSPACLRLFAFSFLSFSLPSSAVSSFFSIPPRLHRRRRRRPPKRPPRRYSRRSRPTPRRSTAAWPRPPAPLRPRRALHRREQFYERCS